MFKPMLSDRAWEAIRPHLPPPKPPGGRGRPRADDRACLEGILLVLRAGLRWRDLPPEVPSGPTCWRRLEAWQAAGCFEDAWAAALDALAARGRHKGRELAIDGSFVPAKKGATRSARPAKARARG